MDKASRIGVGVADVCAACPFRFSGDTMPTENLVKVGRDVTLLIHESSMSPDEEELAREKAHSTSAQAIDIGRR